MTEYNNFWDGDSLGKAGPYSAQIFAAYAQDMNAAGNDLNRGVLLNRGNGVDAPLDVQETSPASKSVRVMAGSAMVPQLDPTEPTGARWYYTDAQISLVVADNTDGSGFDRIDLLVLRSNSTTQTITPVIITGTPAGIPVAPSPVRSGATYDIELAEITAQNLFTTILDADIDNSVRNYTPVWGAKNGGTGIEGGYVAGNMIVGDSVDTLSILPAPTQWDKLQYNSNDNPLMSWQEGRSLFAYSTSVSSAAAAWATITLNTLIDNGGIATSLVANQLLLPAGDYELFWSTFPFYSGGVANGSIQTRLYNVTGAVELSTSNEVAIVQTSAESFGTLYPIQFTMNGTDVLEVQAIRTVGALAVGLTATSLSSTPWKYGIGIRKVGA